MTSGFNLLGLKLSTPGDPIGPGEGAYELAPGVRGYAMRDATRPVVYVPWIVADEPGSGAVAKLLDDMTRVGGYAVPSVMSRKLEGMLRRRRWVLVQEVDVCPCPFEGKLCEVWYPPGA